MKTSLLMDFSVDKQNNAIHIKREFAAPVSKVWAAWTESRYLDQWWAPKPWKTRTKSMDFREGGHWLYAMMGPEGEEHWCRMDYHKISPLEAFSGLDAFCDEEGNINTDFPQARWKNDFNESSGTTVVSINATYPSLADLEKVLEMGIKEGLTAALENLDELLASKAV